MNWYKQAKAIERQHLTPEEREQVKARFGEKLEC
jgi:hypothetical protein